MSGYKPDLEVLQVMLAKAEEKLRIAEVSIQGEFYDDASSRAYYGAFHAVCAVLAQHGLTFSKHHQVIGAFNRDFVNAGIFPARAYKILERLFEDRQIGDYSVDKSVTREMAEDDLEDAGWLVGACRAYLEKEVGQPLRNFTHAD